MVLGGFRSFHVLVTTHNTRSTGNNADDMSEVFHDIAQFERFTDLINLRSMSIKTGKRMLYNFIPWRLFLLAVMVEGDESSQPRIAN